MQAGGRGFEPHPLHFPFLLLFLFGLLPGTAEAQIESGSLVRFDVCITECTRYRGLFLGYDALDLAIYPLGSSEPQRHALSGVSNLAVHAGVQKHRRIGSTLGGLAGLVVGSAIMFASVNECDGPVDILCGLSKRQAVFGTLGVATIGAGIGFWVGAPVEQWEGVRLPGMPFGFSMRK